METLPCNEVNNKHEINITSWSRCSSSKRFLYATTQDNYIKLPSSICAENQELQSFINSIYGDICDNFVNTDYLVERCILCPKINMWIQSLKTFQKCLKEKKKNTTALIPWLKKMIATFVL